MNYYISDVDYMSELMDRVRVQQRAADTLGKITDIVKDFTQLANAISSQPNVLDGSTVEFIMSDSTSSQMYYTTTGGKYDNMGYLAISKTLVTDTSGDFLLQWVDGIDSDGKTPITGYYLWPNGDKNTRILLDSNQGHFNGTPTNSIPGGNYVSQSVFKLGKVDVNSNKQLVCTLSLETTRGHSDVYYIDTTTNYVMGTTNNVTNPNPDVFIITFKTLGPNAWTALISGDKSIAAQCCLSTAANYTNFPDACKNTTCSKTTSVPSTTTTAAPPTTAAPLPTAAPPATPSFWQKYMWYIIGGVSVIVFLIIIIIVISIV